MRGALRPALLPALTFADGRLEALFQASQDGRRRTSDALFCTLNSVPVIYAGVRSFQVGGGDLAQKLVNPACFMLYIALLSFILRSPDAYSRWRGVVLGGMKLAFAALICLAVMNSEEPLADTWPQFVRFELLLYSKGFIPGLQSAILAQPLWQHILVQSCSVLMFLLVNPGTCTAFHARQPSNYGRYQQVAGWLDRALLPSASARRRDCPLADCGQVYCMHVQALLIIGVGFVLPTLAIHAMESRARRRFLLARLQASGGAPPPPQKRGRQAAWLLLYLANLPLGIALLWHWLGWLHAQRVGRYGLRPLAP